MTRRASRVERGICSALRGLHQKEPRRCWRDGEWTLHVKHAVGTVGEEMGCKVYATRCRYRARGEWLYDMTWIREGSDGELVDAPLVLESEWNRDGVSDDFRKLLVARSRYRVMVLAAYDRVRAQEVVDGLVGQVRACTLTKPGDRYLFACWLNTTRDFDFHLHVA